MFEHDRSVARGQMSAQGLMFKHDGRLGNAPAYALFGRMTVEPVAPSEPARAFNNYRVLFDGRPINEVLKPSGAARPAGWGILFFPRP